MRFGVVVILDDVVARDEAGYAGDSVTCLPPVIVAAEKINKE